MILSPYITAVIYAWLLAQGLKYLFASVTNGGLQKNINQLFLSGNMPSAHSASVMALIVTTGYIDGVSSGLFALALLFGAIVMYDAIMVRRSSGEQGAAVVAILKSLKSSIAPPRVAKGHRPIEVVVGAALGALVGYIVVLTTI